jgi:hypothetical protein
MRLLLAAWLGAAAPALGQSFQHRGFLETRATLYPQTAANDSGRAVGDALFRYEASWEALPGVKLFGAFDARTDTHRMTERRWRPDWQDRGRLRPAFSLRRASVQLHRGKVTAELGKQFIRWGRADILNPTDRFAPRDYLNVIDNDFLGVLAGRVTWEAGANTIDLVAAPRFTPSRTPLLEQRWVVLPESLGNVTVRDGGTRIEGRAQFGARWSRAGSRAEYSLVFYEGFHHLPLVEARVVSLFPPVGELRGLHPRLRLYGGDAAVPLRWFTVKAEAAWFTSATPMADEYVLYVVQLERTAGEWFLVGGYAGEAVTRRRNPLDFAPDRGFARALLARAGYTIDARRSVAVESAVRHNGEGVWLKGEYSQQVGTHWRATASFTVIRGDAADFLGQYRRNSHALLALRYSF